jgi:ribosomal protein S27E
MQWQQTEGVGHLDYCYGEDVHIKCNRCGKALCKYRGPQP